MIDAATPRWTRRPQGSNWGDFGPDDQQGRMNLITAGSPARGHREKSVRASFSCSACRSTFPAAMTSIRRARRRAFHRTRWAVTICATIRSRRPTSLATIQSRSRCNIRRSGTRWSIGAGSSTCTGTAIRRQSITTATAPMSTSCAIPTAPASRRLRSASRTWRRPACRAGACWSIWSRPSGRSAAGSIMTC